jgi:hypothetical protein
MTISLPSKKQLMIIIALFAALALSLAALGRSAGISQSVQTSNATSHRTALPHLKTAQNNPKPVSDDGNEAEATNSPNPSGSNPAVTTAASTTAVPTDSTATTNDAISPVPGSTLAVPVDDTPTLPPVSHLVIYCLPCTEEGLGSTPATACKLSCPIPPPVSGCGVCGGPTTPGRGGYSCPMYCLETAQ